MKISFVDLCISGVEVPDNIDDYIDVWHESNLPVSLHEFLGLTYGEYCEFVVSSNIETIIERRKNNA